MNSLKEPAMSVRDKPHYTLPASELAAWIERQPDQWWSVDGDWRLTGMVDFPCPSDELAPALRQIGKNLLVYDQTPGSEASGENLDVAHLNDLADTKNRRRRRTFLLNWADSDEDWLLLDDEALVEK
jgi:hypothetical protein